MQRLVFKLIPFSYPSEYVVIDVFIIFGSSFFILIFKRDNLVLSLLFKVIIKETTTSLKLLIKFEMFLTEGVLGGYHCFFVDKILNKWFKAILVCQFDGTMV